MTDVIVQAITEHPAQLEHRLVAAMRSVALTSIDKPEIARALAAAEGLKDGLVIRDDAHAAELVDVVRQVIGGEKALMAEVAALLRIPKQIERAVADATADVRDRLARARQIGNNARVAYQNELERRAAEVERQKRIEAEAARQAATVQAQEMGDPDQPPAPEIAHVEPERIVRGGSGSSGTQTRTQAVAIEDDAACPASWKTLIPAVAKGFFDTAVRAKEVPALKAGEETVYKGVRFRAVRTAVNR